MVLKSDLDLAVDRLRAATDRLVGRNREVASDLISSAGAKPEGLSGGVLLLTPPLNLPQ